MQKGYEIGALIGTIDPQIVTTVEKFTDVIDMMDFDQVTCYFLLGDSDGSEVVCRCVTCDSGGTNAAAFKTASTLEASPTAHDNVQVIINVSADDLAGGSTNADRYVKFGIVTGSNDCYAAAAVIGYIPKHGPAHADVPDLTTVQEIEDDLD
jgi:hypothetical protein